MNMLPNEERMTELKEYRVGIIGCGGIARHHALAYAAHPQTKIVAVADVNAEATQRIADEFAVGAQYKHYADMLEVEKLDIISICTWPDLHAEMVEAAAASKPKAILCEKPMARDLVETDRMLAAAKKHGVKLAIAHQHRFNPYWNEAKRLIADGAIGEVQLVHQQTLRGLMNNGTHYLDGIRYILGDPEVEWIFAQVQRTTDRWERGGRIEDATLASVAFTGGARALLEVDMPGSPRPAMRVTGSDGVIELTMQTLRYWAGDSSWVDVDLGKPDSHNAQLAELIDWVEGGPVHRGAGTSVRHVMEILMGIYESARTRQIVKPPVAPGPSPLEKMIDDGALPVLVPGRVDI